MSKPDKNTISNRESLHVRLLATGDLLLGGAIEPLVRRHGPAFPFEHVRTHLEEADLVIANLECPITDRGEGQHCETYEYRDLPGFDKQAFVCESVVLRSHPDMVQVLVKGGIEVVNLATNHMCNYGPRGVLDTIRHLDAAGIHHVGAGASAEDAARPAIVERNGLRIGVLGFGQWDEVTAKQPGCNHLSVGAIRTQVSALRSEADVILVSCHWGTQDSRYPTPHQMIMQQAALDAGANSVLGHHPHVLQGIRIDNQRPVFFSLGNFVYEHSEPQRRLSVLAKLDLSPGLAKLDHLIPIRLNDEFQPVDVSGTPQGESTLADISELSRIAEDPSHPEMRRAAQMESSIQLAGLLQMSWRERLVLFLRRFRRVRPHLVYTLARYAIRRLAGKH